MYVHKRGNVYWYSFRWNKQRVQGSTQQGSANVARTIAAAHRAALAKGEIAVGDKFEFVWDGERIHSIAKREPEPAPPPTLKEFIESRFEPWARKTYEHSATLVRLYSPQLHAITAYAPLASKKLPEITGEHIADFAAHRTSEGLKPGSVNAALQVLRRCLRTAAEWGLIAAAPKVKLLSNQARRERVLTPADERLYLDAAPEPLKSVATVLADTGLRPEECFRLRWENVSFESGRYGTLFVTHGKTPAARRLLPFTARVRSVLEARWLTAGKPESGWVWPAPTASGHIEPSTLKKMHARVFKTLAEEAAKHNRKPLQPFVLYVFRHTALTRLAESGCPTWTLAKIAGHSSIQMAARFYVHVSDDSVLDAMVRLQQRQPKQLTQ